ncbi:V-type H(+)-translocating pyrophosphatase, putative [Plasmodium gallinaceum]|uniref:V-type H(+)-translocating pyrophosphatase, putative n=1 Tax=Plasmodium gallinaceum TaxID=5849 RepID=A0A1J1GQI0_PLAGA|nr:V-type H(+)-translocating pyrophosphatase, putative [Plasmodium gallinaceum]CRG94767.1 V-type H(+)-translocating pyrophosphatase, putative [Plasmodium gallinaceum]
MEIFNICNHSSQLKQEIINKNNNFDFYNKKCNESLSTDTEYNVDSLDKNIEKFNENTANISLENNKMKNYFDEKYEDIKNEKNIIPVEIEQNKRVNLNYNKNYENNSKFFQSNISNKNNDSEKFINRNFYLNKKSHLKIDEEEKKEKVALEKNEKILNDQYLSHINSKNDVLKKSNIYLSDTCQNNMQTHSQQTIMCDSQQNLLDMNQNNFHVNSQQTLKYDSEQNLFDFFQNNLYTIPKPTLVCESENNECQRVPLNNNSKQLNYPYNMNTFNKYEQNLISENHQISDIKNEENIMRNENIQNVKDQNDQNLENENEDNIFDEQEYNIKNKDGEFLKNINEQNIDNQKENYNPNFCKQNTFNAYEKILNEKFLNNIHNSYEQNWGEQYQQNSLNSYGQNLTDIKRINLRDINKNHIYNNQITNIYNNDELNLNQSNERSYYNRYGNIQQNNSFLPKIKLPNDVQKSFVSNGIMKQGLNEQNNESSNGFMTIRTLNINSNNKKMKEKQLKGLSDICITKSVSSKTNMHNNNNMKNFKNNNNYIMKINSLRNMNASFYEKKVPYKMNTMNNIITNELENSSTMLQNINNNNSNFQNNQKYLSGKQYLSKYLDNQYKMDEIKNCIPEPTLYIKENFDVPQIIQGLTTKHNNGIVSECNHDTIIEYDNKWRLVHGKTFAINQNDNFKSVEESAEAFHKYLAKKNEDTKKMLMNSNFNSLTGKLVINPVYDENENNMSKVHNYKDTLHAYPSYYNIPRNCQQNENEFEKNNLKDAVEDIITFNKNENNDHNSKNEKITKKKTMVKKQNLALCGDYLLKHRIKDFISVKMKDYFNVNLFNHYI